MTARPIYSIRVEDMISHVEWMLDREDEEVAAGRVELADYADRPPVSQIGMAFARAWQEANHERVTRLLADLDSVQAEIDAEVELVRLDRARSDLTIADGEEVTS